MPGKATTKAAPSKSGNVSKWTKSHEEFCHGLFNGLSQRNAYRKAYPHAEKWKDSTVDVRACELSKDSKIQVRLEEIKAENAKMASLSRESLLARLANIINLEKIHFKGADIVKAIELYAKMCGYEVAPSINQESIDKLTQLFSDVMVVASDYESADVGGDSTDADK